MEVRIYSVFLLTSLAVVGGVAGKAVRQDGAALAMVIVVNIEAILAFPALGLNVALGALRNIEAAYVALAFVGVVILYALLASILIRTQIAQR